MRTTCRPPAILTLLEIHATCPEVFDELEVFIDGEKLLAMTPQADDIQVASLVAVIC